MLRQIVDTCDVIQPIRSQSMSIHDVLRRVVAQPDGAFGMPEADFSKWPKPEDIANAIVFLCSDEAKVIHGAAVPVFGG